jgi:hypothetical protein
VSREQALAFLNEQGGTFEMWKHIMQAGEEFIAGSLLRQCVSPERHSRWCLGHQAEVDLSTSEHR